MVIAVVFAMTVCVFAGNTTIHGTTSGEITDPVHINIEQDSFHTTPVYRVDVEWTALEFTYTEGSWNAESLTYEGDWNDWETNPPTITVKNRSNAAVLVTPTFKDEIDTPLTKVVNGVTASLSGSVGLTSAEGATVDTLPTKTITVSIDNATPTVVEDFDIGTVILTVSPSA